MDENASWHLWDECSEKYLRDLRTEARKLLKEELRRRRVAALTANWLTNVEPLNAVARGSAWVFAQAGKAIVGTIGVVAFGLLIFWLFPELMEAVHNLVDRVFPEGSPASGGEIGFRPQG